MLMTEPSSASFAPVSYRIDCDAGVVYFTLRGDVTFAAVCEIQDALLDDPDYIAGMSIYVDCRVVTSVPNATQVRKLALDRIFRGRTTPLGRVAMVAMTPMGFEYARAWELFFSEGEGDLRLFTSHHAAHAWLGVPAPA